MNEDAFIFDQIETEDLSEEDLAVLRAFEQMENWPPQQNKASSNQPDTPIPPSTSITADSSFENSTGEDENSTDEEMLRIFLVEATEDLTRMRQTLHDVVLDERIRPSHILLLQRVGHKLRGTAAAVGFPVLSEIAFHVEILSEKAGQKEISSGAVTHALQAAYKSLEQCLASIATSGHEPEAESVLTALKEEYARFNVRLVEGDEKDFSPLNSYALQQKDAEEVGQSQKQGIENPNTVPLTIQGSRRSFSLASTPFIRIDARRFSRLQSYTAMFIEQRPALEHAQLEVDEALQELEEAQARLQQVEIALSTSLLTSTQSAPTESNPTSSLVARILQTSPHATMKVRQRLSKLHTDAAIPLSSVIGTWDKLDMEHYTEQDVLLRKLESASADLALASRRLKIAYTHLIDLQTSHFSYVTDMRDEMLLLRKVPFRTLVPRLQRVIATSALAQHISFEVMGENIALNQDILDTLSTPLVQLLRVCIASVNPPEENSGTKDSDREKQRIWFYIGENGYEIEIEIGFSIAIQGGAVEIIRDTVERLHGTITLQRNSMGSISFILHLPSSDATVPCLLVRAGSQRFLVPLSQVQRVLAPEQTVQMGMSISYALYELFNSAYAAKSDDSVPYEGERPAMVLIPYTAESNAGMFVSDVFGEVEVVVKPLESYLQRPGIIGVSVDCHGQTLLVVNLPVLLQRAREYASSDSMNAPTVPAGSTSPIKVLVADDSASIRHSLLSTLQAAKYEVIRASDGLEALEMIKQHHPAVCLLDIEMPMLNGYGVLQFMRDSPELADIKVIMLTSRTSEKHMQQALKLGVDGYLNKPCNRETLLSMVEQVLSHTHA